jgi:hypothetical protein
MTIANVNLSEILIKRGDAISSASYVGPLGEPLYDTGLQTLRIQDGVTPGGQVLATADQVTAIIGNVANLQTVVSGISGLDLGFVSNINLLFANAASQDSAIANLAANINSLQGGVYGNVNVETYLPVSNYLNTALFNINHTVVLNNQSAQAGFASVQGDINGLRSQVYANANVAAYLPTDSTITSIRSDITGANAAVVSYVNTQTGLLQSGITAANAAITTANAAVVSYVNTQINSLIGGAPGTLNTLNLIAANLATDANSIGTILNSIAGANAAIVTANSAVVSYVDAQTGLLQSGINAANASVITANAAMKSYVDAVSVAWQANAATQESEISGLAANVVAMTYTDSNVAAYLPGYTGSLINSSSIKTLTSEVGALQSNTGNLAYSISETISTVENHESRIENLEANVNPGTLTVSGNVTAGNIYSGGFFWANGDSYSSTLSLVATTGRYVDLIDTPILANVAISGDYNDLSNIPNFNANVATMYSNSWTVTAGTNNYSFSVTSGTYQMWVTSNIPNGILVWNATATVTNSNVPVIGQQFAWVYTGGGTPLDFINIPNQFIGTADTIVRSSTGFSNTNTFTFAISNTSGSNQIVNYGWVKIG